MARGNIRQYAILDVSINYKWGIIMEAINWDALAAIGDLVGALAVVATLIYVAIEIKQNTDGVNTARYETITTGFNDIDCAIVADPDLAQMFNQAMIDPGALTQEQNARAAFLFRMFHNQYYKIFHLHQTGVLPKDEWTTYAKQCAQLFGTNGGKRYLEGNSDYSDMIEAVRSYQSDAPMFDFHIRGHGSDTN